MRFYTNVQVSGDNILIREVVNGKRKKRKEQYNPTLYVPSSKKTQFKTLNGDYVEPIKPGSMYETREWIKSYDNVSGFEIFGQTAYQYAWIADEFPEETVEYDIKDICTVSLDIECESERGFPSPETATERINAITIRDIQKKQTYTFGLIKPYSSDNPESVYFQCFTEEDLLTKFIDMWNIISPDIVTGWSISFFDIPYLVNRIKKLLGEDEAKRLSPWNRLREITVAFMNKDVQSYEISGISIIDYLRIYKKYTFASRENYQLGYITQLELGKTKVDHTEYDSMSLFYKNDWQKFITYNIEDALLVEELEKKLKLIDLTLMVAYQAHINYEDVISQVRTWDTIIYNYLKRDNIVIPQKIHMSKDTQYAGAYVKEPKVGLHKWVVSFDIISLYPSIIKCLNIGTETKINDLFWGPCGPDILLDKKESFESSLSTATNSNYTLAVNGVYYKKDRISFYSKMIEKLFNDRVEYRKKAKEAKLEMNRIDEEIKCRGVK